MTTKSIGRIDITESKDGKTRLVRKRGYRAKNKAIKADRLIKAWQKKSPRRSEG